MKINPVYKLFTPEEIFIDIPVDELPKPEEVINLIEFRETGIEFLDTFFQIMKGRRRIQIGQIAKRMQIERLMLWHTVTALTGISPQEWMILYAYKNCCNLLKYTSLEMSDVAKLAGFNSASAFTQFFMRMQKLSPGEWRRANK